MDSVVRNIAHELSGQDIHLITAPGQLLELPPAARNYIALAKDGRLFISQSHKADHEVLAFKELLGHKRISFSVRYVSLSEIAKLYDAEEHRAQLRAGDRQLRNTVRTINGDSDYQLLAMRIIREAAELGASDVHFSMDESRMLIRYRIHGLMEMAPSGGELLKDQGLKLQGAMYGSMCQASSADSTYRDDISQSGRLKEAWVKQAGLFGARIETRPGLCGPNMIIRLLKDSNSTYSSFEDLGYLPEQVKLILPMIHQTAGLVLVSGITGSGKSMSLKFMCEELLRHFNYQIHLLTVEDPIEYKIRGVGVNQTPLLCNEDDPQEVAKAWEKAISNIVRLDIDAAMVGEIRDFGSAMGVMRTVLTGHGIFSTMHTADATSNIQRLLDLGVDPSLVFDPSLVKGFINQCLTPVLCDHCKIPYMGNEHAVTEELASRIDQVCDPAKLFLRGPGCTHCKAGVTRRTIIAEVLSPDIHFMRVFKSHGKAEARAFWVKEMGGITKVSHAIRLLEQGIVDPRNVEADIGRTLDSDIKELGL